MRFILRMTSQISVANGREATTRSANLSSCPPSLTAERDVTCAREEADPSGLVHVVRDGQILTSLRSIDILRVTDIRQAEH